MSTYRITYDRNIQYSSPAHQIAGDKIIDEWYDTDASNEEIEVYEVEVDDHIDNWYESQLDNNPAVISYEQKD